MTIFAESGLPIVWTKVIRRDDYDKNLEGVLHAVQRFGLQNADWRKGSLVKQKGLDRALICKLPFSSSSLGILYISTTALSQKHQLKNLFDKIWLSGCDDVLIQQYEPYFETSHETRLYFSMGMYQLGCNTFKATGRYGVTEDNVRQQIGIVKKLFEKFPLLKNEPHIRFDFGERADGPFINEMVRHYGFQNKHSPIPLQEINADILFQGRRKAYTHTLAQAFLKRVRELCNSGSSDPKFKCTNRRMLDIFATPCIKQVTVAGLKAFLHAQGAETELSRLEPQLVSNSPATVLLNCVENWKFMKEQEDVVTKEALIAFLKAEKAHDLWAVTQASETHTSLLCSTVRSCEKRKAKGPMQDESVAPEQMQEDDDVHRLKQLRMAISTATADLGGECDLGPVYGELNTSSLVKVIRFLTQTCDFGPKVSRLRSVITC